MINRKSGNQPFQKLLYHEHNQFVDSQKTVFPADEILKIDLHCHDLNSDTPDERLGRILNVPETWLKTERLIKTLKRSKMDVFTITNHNNSRSCTDLKKQGIDILSGAEFTCQVPDFEISIHVLAYGFSSEQETMLNKLRKNVYQFQRYAFENDIPTIWAHPLFYYSSKDLPSVDFFNKMALIFERFEVINGQRDTWQNMLVKSWIETLTPHTIDCYAEQFGIKPKQYCKNPYKKSMSAGSDSHIGTFSGQTFTQLHVPNLSEIIKTTAPSILALEAIKAGDMAPQGTFQNAEKLTIAFLDYFCQVALNKKDPGLMRVLLHKGTTKEKIEALVISNVLAELQHHRFTIKFIQLFHNCLTGRSPHKITWFSIPPEYKPSYNQAIKISKVDGVNNQNQANEINSNLDTLYFNLLSLLVKRLHDKAIKLKKEKTLKFSDWNELIDKFELPSDIRTLIGKNNNKNKRVASFKLGAFLDGLSFPFLSGAIILGANFTATKTLYNNRNLLNKFAKLIGKLEHPERILWLTDRFDGKDEVSLFLQQFHKEVRKHNLPVDFLVCSDTVAWDEHLIVLKPLTTVNIPFWEHETIGIPDFLEIHNLFLQNGYDRLICSTEGIMGLVSIYLKHAFSVKASFYLHTEWETFASQVMKIDRSNISRLRRVVRTFYNSFDSLFVLNEEQKNWLTGRGMNIPAQKIYHTAHWTNEMFKTVTSAKMEIFNAPESSMILLYAGSVSKENGVFELPEIYGKLHSTFPNLLLAIAGTGPDLNELKSEVPEAIFLGEVARKNLPWNLLFFRFDDPAFRYWLFRKWNNRSVSLWLACGNT